MLPIQNSIHSFCNTVHLIDESFRSNGLLTNDQLDLLSNRINRLINLILLSPKIDDLQITDLHTFVTELNEETSFYFHLKDSLERIIAFNHPLLTIFSRRISYLVNRQLIFPLHFKAAKLDEQVASKKTEISSTLNSLYAAKAFIEESALRTPHQGLNSNLEEINGKILNLRNEAIFLGFSTMNFVSALGSLTIRFSHTKIINDQNS